MIEGFCLMMKGEIGGRSRSQIQGADAFGSFRMTYRGSIRILKTVSRGSTPLIPFSRNYKSETSYEEREIYNFSVSMNLGGAA